MLHILIRPPFMCFCLFHRNHARAHTHSHTLATDSMNNSTSSPYQINSIKFIYCYYYQRQESIHRNKKTKTEKRMTKETHTNTQFNAEANRINDNYL